MTSGRQIKTVKCPSCGTDGYLVGLPVGRSGAVLKSDGVYEEIRSQPEVFECKCCELKIKGLDELMAAGFPHEFTLMQEKDVFEHFGIDPVDYVDVDELLRDHLDSAVDYQDE